MKVSVTSGAQCGLSLPQIASSSVPWLNVVHLKLNWPFAAWHRQPYNCSICESSSTRVGTTNTEPNQMRGGTNPQFLHSTTVCAIPVFCQLPTQFTLGEVLLLTLEPEGKVTRLYPVRHQTDKLGVGIELRLREPLLKQASLADFLVWRDGPGDYIRRAVAECCLSSRDPSCRASQLNGGSPAGAHDGLEPVFLLRIRCILVTEMGSDYPIWRYPTRL